MLPWPRRLHNNPYSWNLLSLLLHSFGGLTPHLTSLAPLAPWFLLSLPLRSRLVDDDEDNSEGDNIEEAAERAVAEER